MRTITEVKITAEVEGIRLGYWDEAKQEFIEVNLTNEETINEAAKALDCSPRLIDAIATSFNTLAEATHTDMLDIWARLDKMEKGQ